MKPPQTHGEPLKCAEVSNMMNIKIYLKGESNLLNHNKLKMDKANSYIPCMLDGDIEKGMPDTPKSINESVGNLKNEDFLAGVFLAEFILWIRGKYVQPLMNYRTQRVYDTGTNRSRKFNRIASFNSRRVVLLSSVLSCVGTVILIYLTLRGMPIGDASLSV